MNTVVIFWCHVCIYYTHILGIVATIGIGGNSWNQQMDRRSKLLSTPRQGVESCGFSMTWFPLRCGNHTERCPPFAELYDASFKRFCKTTPTQSTRSWSLTSCTEERRLQPVLNENNLEVHASDPIVFRQVDVWPNPHVELEVGTGIGSKDLGQGLEQTFRIARFFFLCFVKTMCILNSWDNVKHAGGIQ